MRFWGPPAAHRTEGKVKLSTKEVGEWRVARSVLTVTYAGQEKSAPLGAFALNPQALARVLLTDLVSEDFETNSVRAQTDANGNTGLSA
jgi:hypothetical protein